MGKTSNDSPKITLDQYYGISKTQKKNGTVYLYLRYRNGKIKDQVSLSSDFLTLSKSAQQKEYKRAKEELDTKLGISKDDNRDMRKVPFIELYDKYLQDYYETVVQVNNSKRRDFDSKQTTSRNQILRHSFAQRTVDELVSNDRFIKEFFKESREGFISVLDGKEIKPCAKSTIDKQVWLIISTFRFARFDRKWISADDFETLNYLIAKYREVGTYSKKEKNRRLTEYEFTLFHQEILERRDTSESYKEMFYQEVAKRTSDPQTKAYIRYLFRLERARTTTRKTTLRMPITTGLDIENALEIYNNVETELKSLMETGYMKTQPLLHYPVVRYYRNSNGAMKTTCDKEELPEFADMYIINRKNTTFMDSRYYFAEATVTPLFLLFLVNTGLRFNEGRCLQVLTIKQRNIQISPTETISAYYLQLENQIEKVMDRDEDGNIKYDEDGNRLFVDIVTDLKTSSSVREIPLNNTCIRILKMIEEITGTIIFNEDGTISDTHAERFIFVNYNKAFDCPSKRFMGREGAFLNNLKTHLTYGKLRDMKTVNEDHLRFHFRDVEDKEFCKNYYYRQILEIKKKIDSGEEFDWDKQIYVLKIPTLINNSGANTLLKQILRNMRVPDADEISIHDLRRTASSIMSAKGQDKIDIQHVIGHSEGSEVTEDVYIKSHFYPALKAVQALDSALDEYKMNPVAS